MVDYLCYKIPIFETKFIIKKIDNTLEIVLLTLKFINIEVSIDNYLNTDKLKGKVFLVGAGPGDPELITAKGLKAIQNADIILHDALIHPHLVFQ